MYQLVSGVNSLHSYGMIHRDLKPPNLLYEPRTKSLKIADFGLTRKVNSMNPESDMSFSNEIETHFYRSPELLLGSKKYTTTVDIWTLGIIFYELLTAQLPFGSLEGRIASDWGAAVSIFQVFGLPSDNYWPEFKQLPFYTKRLPRFKKGAVFESKFNCLAENERSLVLALLEMNPMKRIDARRAMEHSYFKNLSLKSPMKVNSGNIVSSNKDQSYLNRQTRSSINHLYN